MTAVTADVGSYVEAYEEARQRGDVARLEDFLPPAGHPLRLGVLRELVPGGVVVAVDDEQWLDADTRRLLQAAGGS